MLFDFNEYLHRLDPGQIYLLEPLTGGVCNVTARAVRQIGSTDTSEQFPDHPSFILKHAPPFVAAVGESAPMSQSRQLVEARALSFFEEGHPLGGMPDRAHVQVPKLLHYDPHDHVIIMSDLGRLIPLSDVFGSLGGWTPLSPAVSAPPAFGPLLSDSLSQEEMFYFSHIGSRAGMFFALMHTQTSLSAVRDHAMSDSVHLENITMQGSVLEHAIKPIESHLNRFGDLLPKSRSTRELYLRIEENALRANSSDEISVVLGDCWTGAVLVSRPSPKYRPSGSSTENATYAVPEVCVIDYEFASLNRGVHGDIAQFLAHLECFLLVAQHHEEKSSAQQLELLMTSFIDGYRQTAAVEGAPWLPSHEDHMSIPQPGQLRACVIRSAIISMAAEVMNITFWKSWPCRNRLCPGMPSTEFVDGTDENKPEVGVSEVHDVDKVHLCPVIREMASLSIWLLDHAGADEEEMCKQHNWNELLLGPPGRFADKSKKGRRWLLDLFI